MGERITSIGICVLNYVKPASVFPIASAARTLFIAGCLGGALVRKSAF